MSRLSWDLKLFAVYDTQTILKYSCMKIALLDDDIEYHNVFERTLTKHNIDVDVEYYSDVNSFEQKLLQCTYDVIFLDVELHETNGIQFAQKLSMLNINSYIVFVTNYPENVFSAFGVNVMGFIPKYRLDLEIDKIWNRIIRETQKRKIVTLKLSNNQLLNIRADSVYYCEVVLRRIYLYTKTDKYILAERTISHVFESLNDGNDCFVFANRSCFVNSFKIETIIKQKLKLADHPKMIDISRGRIAEVKNSFYYHGKKTPPRF